MNVWSLIFYSMEEEIVIYIHLQQIPICCCLPACLPTCLPLCSAGGRCELNITPDELMNIRFYESRRSLGVSAVVERRWRRRPRSGGVTRRGMTRDHPLGNTAKPNTYYVTVANLQCK